MTCKGFGWNLQKSQYRGWRCSNFCFTASLMIRNAKKSEIIIYMNHQQLTLTERRRQIFGSKVSDVTHGGESLKQNVMTYLSKMTAEVAWPSNKSLFCTNFTFSSPTSFFFFFAPAVRGVAFLRSSSPKWFPALSTLPWGHERQTTYFCKSGWIFAPLLMSCWSLWQEECVRPAQQIAQRGDLKKSACGWERVVFVCSDSAAVNDDALRLVWSHRWQALVAYARLFSLYSRAVTLSLSQTFTFHLGDDRQHAVHSLLHHSPGGT